MTDIRTIATGLLFPEGPVVLEDGSIALVEIARGTITRVFLDGRTEVVAEPGGGPNGLAIGPDKFFYVCNSGGSHWIREDGVLRSIAKRQALHSRPHRARRALDWQGRGSLRGV